MEPAMSVSHSVSSPHGIVFGGGFWGRSGESSPTDHGRVHRILLREVQSMLSGLGHTLQRLLLMALGVPDWSWDQRHPVAYAAAPKRTQSHCCSILQRSPLGFGVSGSLNHHRARWLAWKDSGLRNSYSLLPGKDTGSKSQRGKTHGDDTQVS